MSESEEYDAIRPPDSEEQGRDLLAMIEEMGSIECSCGWSGKATESAIQGKGSQRDLACPRCLKKLYVVGIDY